jgi:hypothetical protein
VWCVMLTCLFCRFMQVVLEPARGEKCCGIGNLSMGKESRMLQSLILIGALSSACWGERERERERLRPVLGDLFLFPFLFHPGPEPIDSATHIQHKSFLLS